MDRVANKTTDKCLAQFRKGLEGPSDQRCVMLQGGRQVNGALYTIESLAIQLTALVQYDEPDGRKRTSSAPHRPQAQKDAIMGPQASRSESAIIGLVQEEPRLPPPPTAGPACWSCDSLDHVQRDCPVVRVSLCWVCGPPDHLSSHCPRKERMGRRCSRCQRNGHDPSGCRDPTDGKPRSAHAPPSRQQREETTTEGQDFRRGGSAGSAGSQSA